MKSTDILQNSLTTRTNHHHKIQLCSSLFQDLPSTFTLVRKLRCSLCSSASTSSILTFLQSLGLRSHMTLFSFELVLTREHADDHDRSVGPSFTLETLLLNPPETSVVSLWKESARDQMVDLRTLSSCNRMDLLEPLAPSTLNSSSNPPNF